MMPSGKAAALLLTCLLVVLSTISSSAVATSAATLLWTRHGIRCPGILLVGAVTLLVVVLTLPVFG